MLTVLLWACFMAMASASGPPPEYDHEQFIRKLQKTSQDSLDASNAPSKLEQLDANAESKLERLVVEEDQLIDVGTKLAAASKAQGQKLARTNNKLEQMTRELGAALAAKGELEKQVAETTKGRRDAMQESGQLREQVQRLQAKLAKEEGDVALLSTRSAKEHRLYLDEQKKHIEQERELKAEASQALQEQIAADTANEREREEHLRSDLRNRELQMHERSQHLAEEEQEWKAERQHEQGEISKKRTLILKELGDQQAKERSDLKNNMVKSVAAVKEEAEMEVRQHDLELEKKLTALKEQFEREKHNIIYNRQRKHHDRT